MQPSIVAFDNYMTACVYIHFRFTIVVLNRLKMASELQELVDSAWEEVVLSLLSVFITTYSFQSLAGQKSLPLADVKVISMHCSAFKAA